jgi:phage-related baseplate assembly protein
MKGELIEAIKGQGGPQRQGVVPGASAAAAPAAPKLEGDERLRELAKMPTERLRHAGADVMAAKIPTPARWQVLPG